MGTSDTLIRLSVQGLIDGSTYGLLGLSFGYILFVTGRLHFAYGFTYTLAGYVVAVMSVVAGVPLWLAATLAIFAAVVASVLIETSVYRPLVKRNPSGSLISVFVAALGINVAGDALITLIWGTSNESRYVSNYVPTIFHVGPLYLADVQIATVVFAIVVVAVSSIVLKYTEAGRMVRAVSANSELARIMGIRLELVYIVIFALASVVAGVLAVLTTMRLSATPEMGNTPVFYGFLVAFLAGRGSGPIRVAIAGLIVGLVSDVSQFWLSPEYGQVVIFGMLSVYIASQPFVKDRLTRSSRRRSSVSPVKELEGTTQA